MSSISNLLNVEIVEVWSLEKINGKIKTMKEDMMTRERNLYRSIGRIQ